MIIRILFFLFLAILSGCNKSNDFSQLEGPKASNFELLDHEGKAHELYYYSDMKAVVLIWQGNGCPIFRQSILEINRLQKKFEKLGIVFLLINANPQDDRFSIKKEAEEFNINIPILEDSSQMVTKSLSVTRTAESIVLDTKSWKTIYRGAINDRLGYEVQKTAPIQHFLENALNTWLQGRLPQIKRTPFNGCLINFLDNPKLKQVTYTADVAPILKNKCTHCHIDEGIAPWTMKDYKTVRGWGAMIREVILNRRMPPWKPDPYYGEFRNNISLTPDETRTLVYWIDEGYKRGPGEDPLANLKSQKQKKWPLGEPDLILSAKEQQKIPATGLIPYRYVFTDKQIKEDIYVNSVDFYTKHPNLLHHSMVAYAKDELKMTYEMSASAQNGGSTIEGFVPGYSPHNYGSDTGIFIPKGAKIFFELHYVTNGKEAIDTPKVGLYFTKNKPKRIVKLEAINNREIQIPPNEENYEISSTYNVEGERLLHGIYGHMHYRGKRIKYTALFPDGRKKILLSIPSYDFNWQWAYMFEDPISLPKGTKIISEGAFDNSKQNLANPDPTQEIRFGPQSYDEMFLSTYGLSSETK